MFRTPKGSPIPTRRTIEKKEAFRKVRDALNMMALCKGNDFLQITNWKPSMQFAGRDYEVWQPLLALASLIEEAGATGLVQLIYNHAEQTIANNSDYLLPETDEILLKLLKEQVDINPGGVTSKDILDKAKSKEPSLFGTYNPRGVSATLRKYGLKTLKSNGRRIFRPCRDDYKIITDSYGVDFTSS